MMRIFFDSSAFAKRYVREQSSEEVLRLCDQATELALAVIALPEIISAFCRLQREHRISDSQYQQLKTALFEDIADVALCELTPEVIQQAVQSLEAHILRGMDAIHIGCALAWQAELFISADRRQSAILILARSPVISAWMPKSSVHGWQSFSHHRS